MTTTDLKALLERIQTWPEEAQDELIADLKRIAAHYASTASPAIAEAIGLRLASVIDRISRAPKAAPRVSHAHRFASPPSCVIRSEFSIDPSRGG
jgi:hypothetical protein